MKKILGLALILLVCSTVPGLAGVAVYGSYWETEALGATGGVGAALRSDSSGFAWELRAGYFPDITEEIEALLDDIDPVGLDLEVKAVPIDLGVVYQFGSESFFKPFAGGGVSYFLLESNIGNVSDEVGFYGVAGIELGSGSLGFIVEGIYRVVEGTLESDIEDWEDLIDFEIDDKIALDLGGYGFNVGVIWRW